MAQYKLKSSGWTVVSLLEEGATQFDGANNAAHVIEFDQDAWITSVIAKKPANGTLDVLIEPSGVPPKASAPTKLLQAPIDNISCGTADTCKLSHKDIPLPKAGRIVVTSATVTGDKYVTVIARSSVAHSS